MTNLINSMQFGKRSLTDITKLNKQANLTILDLDTPHKLGYMPKDLGLAITYLDKQSDELLTYKCNNLLTSNAKLSDTNKNTGAKVTGFNLPALVATRIKGSDYNIRICRCAGVCSKGCFAMINNWLYMSTIATNDIKYYLSLLHPQFFKNRIQRELDAENPSHVRLHSSGDFYSRDYFLTWLNIARDNPSIIFYAYTKEHRLVKQFNNLKNVIPSNFVYILSEGSKDDCIKPRDRQARVFKREDDIPSNFVNASHNDLLALGTNHLIGLSYH
jgi:hypothetical protein